jgi:ketosteroid isomerase-like protein
MPTERTVMPAEWAAWLERYRRAWIERDADAAAALFTDDATYREQAFEEPFAGREAIRQYWARVTAGQRDIELAYGEPVAAGARVAVEWWANLLHDGEAVTLAGEFMLVFAPGGQCRELREYWVMTPGRRDPPEGWGQ